ncbi:regulatory protein RecX [Corallincola spongiicola]|uniref:Regulatory protein RecX n=1 Tax=Corallincola spongiicola TaxID=2520508 RepID=A0ABY1WRK6_9GAMM|nr:regulatory protein RecX [Corallincola spongiicola]TAA47370.1 regulatory protein RecX [Corallincola spongiicola]
MRLLARRDHSHQELANKLRQRRFSSSDIATVLDKCAEHGWLDEPRFCDSYIRRRSQQGYGPQRIRAELIQRGIDKTLISDALKLCSVDWQLVLSDCIQRRFDSLSAQREERAKQLRFLLYRGFNHDLIQQLGGN